MARLFLLVLSTVTIFISCTSTKPAGAVSTALRTLPPLPASEINIPIQIYLKPLLSMMDSSTAKEFRSEKWPEYHQVGCDFRYKYRFIRSSFLFSCINNRVNIAFRGNYQIAGSRTVCAFDRQVSPWVSGSCGFGNEALRRVDVNITSLLELLPNHQIRTTTVLNKLQPLDKCQVTLLQNDMTGEIMDSIRASVESYTRSFDSFIQELNNHAGVTHLKAGGSKVLPFSDYGYFNLNPKAIRIGKFNYARDTLMFSVGYTGTPEFSSDSLRIVTRKPLPPVTNTESSPIINTYLNAVYDYSFFNRLLNDSLQNKPFTVEGRTFVIDDISLQGSDEGKIFIDIAFSGSRKGVLKLSGTPLLDSATQVISMPDISFDVATRDMLINIAKGLFRKKIMKQLHDKSVLDVAALITRHKDAISTRLNQPINAWLSTRGRLNQLRVVGLMANRNQLQVQLHINANLVMIGHPSPTQFMTDKD